MGVGNQGVPGDAGNRLVSLGDAPIDNEDLSSRFYRGLPLADLYRHMAVDDPGPVRGDAELRQDLCTTETT